MMAGGQLEGGVAPDPARDRLRCGYLFAIVEAGMATKIAVALEDDLSGGPADETIRFGLGGFDYEIDLSKKNAAAFRKKVAPYIGHARKAGRGQRRRPARTSSARDRSGDIRAWARDNGIAVSDRGRIAASVAEQYDAANS
jgi:Lsr2